MKFKYLGLISIYGTVISILVFVMAFAASGYGGFRIVNSYKADMLVQECNVIDNALLMYSKAHTAVLSDTVAFKDDTNGNERLTYQSGHVYPKNLTELGIVQNKFAYFASSIDLSKFKYTTRIKNDGSMTYELGVTMPNGYFYTSPQSNK